LGCLQWVVIIMDPVILTRMDTDIRIRIHTRMDIRILLIKHPFNILSNPTNLMSIMGITVSKTACTQATTFPIRPSPLLIALNTPMKRMGITRIARRTSLPTVMKHFTTKVAVQT